MEFHVKDTVCARGVARLMLIGTCHALSIQTEQTGEKEEEGIHISGCKAILVVEDETMILKMTSTMLQRLGYVVLAASTPNQAIHIAKKFLSLIDLVLTDVIMPEMNGRELVERLLKIQTGMKFLYMSGYTADLISNHGMLDEGVLFIQKPFSKKELATKVLEALTWRTNSD